ncbi:apolipoprotein N-acyltransferase [Bartonella sp. WD12.1]|nr:apolipoprotein N-acyltransferase [Bartonella sp. WD12.1]
MVKCFLISSQLSYFLSLVGNDKYVFFMWCAYILCAPPFYLTPVSFLTFPIFVILLDAINTIQNFKKRLLISALTCGNFGFGYFVYSLWWASNALLIDPITYAWTIPFVIFGLPIYLALYWFFAGFIIGWLWTKGIARFLFAFALGLAEWLRAILFTGFPWNALGYTAMPTPMFMQSDMIVGLYGMNILSVLVYSLPTVLLTNEKRNLLLFFVFYLY